ncbi:MAG: hypothetical protein ABWY11_01665 [Umezawaea sp.]
MTQRNPDREQWLADAMTGGLPEPVLRRWLPLRVGIVNLWEYDQAEFWFADGRLVLRGGNGAGKTKVLELTTLMLLRGEIGASVLDPFGSQHCTMRFNLLSTGDDDDPRPLSDTGLGYAWVEFGRLDDDGEARFFVRGLGVSARRGTGTSVVTTWHLLTHLRPGRDLRLSVANRPLDLNGLKKITGVSVPDSAARYRARVATELFGLGPDAVRQPHRAAQAAAQAQVGRTTQPHQPRPHAARPCRPSRARRSPSSPTGGITWRSCERRWSRPVLRPFDWRGLFGPAGLRGRAPTCATAPTS